MKKQKANQRFLFRAQTRAVLPNGAILHASSVEQSREAVVFLAPSGGGKSTIALNLAQKNFFLLADDTVIIAEGTDGTTRCLPCGSLKLSTGHTGFAPANLKAFVFLEKGSSALPVRVSPLYSFYRAIRINSVIGASDLTVPEKKQLRGFLRRTFATFPSYILRYPLESDPAELICELLRDH
ncbi:MAG: hypothetical protein GY852_10980 [bacterium]|nr:hypothetical protein [bacterium]